MTDNALITKPGISHATEEDFSHLESISSKTGVDVIRSYSNGILISGNKEKFTKIEKEGFRVIIYRDTNILNIGTYRINIEEHPFYLKSHPNIPQELLESWPHHLVQLQAPPTKEWVSSIEKIGIKVVEPIPPYGLVVFGMPENIKKLQDLSFISWIGPFLPKYKINDNLLNLKGNIQYINILVYPPNEIDSIKEKILQLNGKIIKEKKPDKFRQTNEFSKLIVELQSDNIFSIASLPFVRSMEYAGPKPGLDGEREVQIIAHNLDELKPIVGYQNWLSKIKLSGEGVTISICDTGIEVK